MNGHSYFVEDFMRGIVIDWLTSASPLYRAVIQAHLTLGNMFTTIDEDHFKSSLNG